MTPQRIRATERTPAPKGRTVQRRTEPLTEREPDVVRLVARGLTNEELSAQLYVTRSTVKTHLANVQRKLAARNRVEIAAWVWENGKCAPSQVRGPGRVRDGGPRLDAGPAELDRDVFAMLADVRHMQTMAARY